MFSESRGTILETCTCRSISTITMCPLADLADSFVLVLPAWETHGACMVHRNEGQSACVAPVANDRAPSRCAGASLGVAAWRTLTKDKRLCSVQVRVPRRHCAAQARMTEPLRGAEVQMAKRLHGAWRRVSERLHGA